MEIEHQPPTRNFSVSQLRNSGAYVHRYFTVTASNEGGYQFIDPGGFTAAGRPVVAPGVESMLPDSESGVLTTSLCCIHRL